MNSKHPDPGGIRGEVLAYNVLVFGRALRKLGLKIGTDHIGDFLRAMVRIGIERQTDVRAAGRAIFAKRKSERDLFDEAFELFWRRATAVGRPSKELPRMTDRWAEEMAQDDTGRNDPDGVTLQVDLPREASRRELLRTKNFADLTPEEVRDASAMVASLRPTLPRRPARRPRIHRSGRRPAMRYMLRHALSTGGEALLWRWYRRSTRLRPLVFVLDISGSMERYSRFMLRFAHALARTGAPLEVFVFGTRLTRITRELRTGDPDTALSEVARRVVDWSGGTRIGASLRTLNRLWVRRTVRSSAIVLLVSDGWERDDPTELARQMATLQRSCHALIWLDPLASRPGFEPVTQGLRAALPFVDAFVPCGTVASLEALAEKLPCVS